MSISGFPRFVPAALLTDGWWLTTTTQSGVDGPRRPDGAETMRQWFPPVGLWVLLLVLLADWLLWDRYIGVSLAILAMAVVGTAIALTWNETSPRTMIIAAGTALIGALPIVNAIGFFPVCFLILGSITAVLILNERLTRHVLKNAKTYLGFLFTGPFWIILDIVKPRQKIDLELPTKRFVNAWIVPIGLGLIFLSLFAEANPVVEELVFSVINIEWLEAINMGRILFWLGVSCLIWPFFNLREARADQASLERKTRTAPVWFEAHAIRNALVIFNGLFAVQTMLDLSFLWAGASLPEGMTYAQYAHRGAYPLLATSLLAGIFMLAATSFGTLSANTKVLLYVWIAQNLALVISSVLRLNLYVAFYSLTYLRVASFIWFGLVLVGLMLIAYRLYAERSNGWVVSRLVGLGAITLYLGCFVNFASLIAEYNVAHSKEVSGHGLALDRDYLSGLGAHAYPAADRYLKLTGSPVEWFHRTYGSNAGRLAYVFWRHQENWRDWGLRDARLASYLRTQY